MKQSNRGWPCDFEEIIYMGLDLKLYGGMSYIVLRTNIIIKCLDYPVN